MMMSPPGSPTPSNGYRSISMVTRSADRSGSRMSLSSRHGAGSRASDEDTRTAVRVAVRVRPPLKPNEPNYELIPPRFQRNIVNVTSSTSLAIDSPQGKKLFVFDRVFDEETNQKGIWDYVSDSVNSFMQGYNVSILAYGQSGAGKSHTMGTSGPGEYETEALGIIPRAAQALFEKLDGSTVNKGVDSVHARNQSTGLKTPKRYSLAAANPVPFGRKAESTHKNWQLKATYVEIYNEHLRDLLIPDSIPPGERPPVTIREDVKGRIILTGLRSIDINSIDDLLSALDFGSSIRQTDATAVNAQSSRSHAVFSLNLVLRHDGGAIPNGQPMSKAEKRMSMPANPSAAAASDGEHGGSSVTINSKLHFVDLAGSERMKHTGASGERAREGISINAGLASLGKVISQLSARNPGTYVSYRDSKLTRLLQDSLGGNAITYMIACVTPVEFHLNETLNTVQYAQRARAIQSKPHIQQVTDDGDKNAVIDRLKAEIAFLRTQISSAQDSANKADLESAQKASIIEESPAIGSRASSVRGDRQNGREKELQNALLDAQESYSALSQRHAKLIAEMSKASGSSSDLDPESAETLMGANAMDRLKRSHSFAESVEQVVLEYEKTIQSLETSLSQTRSSLATVESSLLERETKCAYVETVNNQLQARIQKLMDREANTDNYLQMLEEKLDGQATGEGKYTAIITGLQKEIARARQNEASCEDYISTLEDRLAESDQDAELMQREIERLEHVIDRQRSLGKLDNLLSELDDKPQNHTRKMSQQSTRSGKDTQTSQSYGYEDTPEKALSVPEPEQFLRSKTPSVASSERMLGEPLSIVEEELAEDEKDEPADDTTAKPKDDASMSYQATRSASTIRSAQEEKSAQEHDSYISSQSLLVIEQLAAVNQELADVRTAYESRTCDFERLNLKYGEALRNIAEMKYAIDEMKYNQQDQPTDSVIGPLSRASTRTRGSSNETTRSASAEPSRSLGVELDSAGHPQASLSTSRPPFSRLNSRMDSESNISDTEASFYDAPDQTGSTTSLAPSTSKNPPASDVEHMQRLLRDQKQGMILVKQRYEQLHSEHDRTLRLVEQLKSDLIVSRQESASNSGSSGSPTRSTTPGHTPASSMSHKPHVVRRVTSQSLAGTDRAHRFLASLRNVAAEEFEERPDALNNFEYNLNATMHELHMRMERIEDLESENQTLKKELESKAIIITGLTRERSSLSAATPQLDLSFVGQLQEQIQSYENKLKEMQEEHDSRVKTLTAEVSSLNQLIDDQRKELLERDEKIITLEQESKRWQDKHDIVASSLEETEKKLQSTLTQLESALSGRIDMEDKHNSAANELDSKVNLLDTTAAELEEARAKYRELENKHNHASSSLENYKEQLQSTLAELESSLKQVGLLEKERDALSKGDLATEQAKHKEEVESLNRDIENYKRDIEEHRSVIDDHLKTISDLEDSLEEANKRASANERSGTNSSQEIEELRRKVTLLTAEVETRKETVEHREMELGNMQAEHSRELEALEEKMAAAEKEHGNRMNERTVAHGKELKALRSEIEESRNEVEQLVGKVSHLLETEIPDVFTLYEKIEKTVKDKEYLTKELSDLVDANESLMQQVALKEQLEKEVKELTSKATNHETKAQELALLVATHEEAMNDMEAALQKKDKILAQVQAEKEKSARLVQELEDQISSSFDDHNNRLSMIREERIKAIDDANLKIASLENDVEGYRSRIASLESQLREGGHERANSIASTARKSASAAALPSPPPAIPLPPLPNVKSSGAATPTFNNSPKSTTGSPVASRHPSQEIAASNARLEEQEARIRTIEKHLHAEKQLTATLEEALGDLESQSNKIKNDLETWKKKAWQYEDELAKMKSERDKQRISLQAVEEERTARRQAEAARAHLEEKMNALDKKKKKKSTLNCF